MPNWQGDSTKTMQAKPRGRILAAEPPVQAAGLFAEVAFNLPLDRTFHYLIPEPLRPSLKPGMRVAVPFGRMRKTGFVVAVADKSPVKELKAIRRVIDPFPVIDGERWQLARWISSYYYCSLGEALSALVPSALRLKEPPDPSGPAASQVTGEEKPLFAAQAEALQKILKNTGAGKTETVLLHGVTGSGKTEVYLQAIAQMLKQGRSAICLIPEIALTPQTLDRFQGRFGARVIVWHSRLTASQRAAAWWRMATEPAQVVVGARSCVFAPVKNLGLIILDEEHEATYKQEDTPRYHAREVARKRAELTGATVILGSATPSVESYEAASRGIYQLAELPERIGGRPMPAIEIVDMAGEWTGRARGGPLSMRLQQALEKTIAQKQQAMLMLNRRGFARVAQCQSCGFTVRCKDCAVPLIYHASAQQLICHYCNAAQPLAELCPACKKGYLKLRGSGTERVESELHRHYPSAAIARMDRDTTQKAEQHQVLYEGMRSGDISLLVGTQMVAKGHDFPDVTLVGIVLADTALNLPDFRAGEWTFDLLAQAAGRAGRGEHPGKVIIQTYCPAHYAIKAAQTHDYAGFYKEEAAMRKQVQLPPFTHLIELTVQGASKEKVSSQAAQLAQLLRKSSRSRRVAILGPAPHRIPRLRKNYRACLLMKGQDVPAMSAILKETLQSGRKFGGLLVAVNVDPL